jgi:broad specificity phosphatase PhoE
MKLYFCRHGESEANRLHIISNRRLPHALTEAGKSQSAALADRLLSENIGYIFTSPIPRAIETAEIVSNVLGVPYEANDALREFDCGILEGHGDQRAWKEFSRWKENWLAGRDLDKGPEGGETFNDVQKRFVPFIENLVRENLETGSEFVLIGHGETYLFGLPFVLNNMNYDFILSRGFGNTQMVTAGLRGDKLVCLIWGEEVLTEKIEPFNPPIYPERES